MTHGPRRPGTGDRYPHDAGLDPRVPLSILGSIDRVLRDSAVFGLVVDAPGTVALRHDILAAQGALRRVVVDSEGVVEDVVVPLEHACLSCAVREDALPTIDRLARDGRWDHVLLALPVTAESFAVSRALASATGPGGELPTVRVSTTLAVIDVETVEDDLLGFDLVRDRGTALTEDDERSVGEALAALLEHVDLVVTTGDDDAHPTSSGLVDRLRAATSRRLAGLHELSALDLAASDHDAAAGEARAFPLGARGAHGLPSSGSRDRSWTLELTSHLPFHPQRLLDEVERLGTGRLRSRGVFWVPNRPGSVCMWDGAGGQLSIGEIGPWRDRLPQTRLVFVGATTPDDDPRDTITEAFGRALATPAEMLGGDLHRLDPQDALEPWLGARDDAA